MIREPNKDTILKCTNTLNSDNLYWTDNDKLKMPTWRTLINQDGSLFGEDFSSEYEFMVETGYIEKKLAVQSSLVKDFSAKNFITF